MNQKLLTDLAREVEHLQAMVDEQSQEIRSLQSELSKTAKDRTRYRDRCEELRSELAKYVRADNPVLRGKKK